MTDYDKLVRDKIPQFIRSKGKECTARYVLGDDLVKRLRDKLEEEVNEFLDAKTQNEMEEELADIYEVIEGIVRANNLDVGYIEEIKKKKRSERGGFYEGCVLIYVEE